MARRSRRGASLVEALIAMVVVTVATASITTLLKSIGDASRRMTFQTAALDVYAELAAQLEDARCNVDPTGLLDLDPGLAAIAAVNAPNWVTAPTAGSLITRIGDLRYGDPFARAVPLNVNLRAIAPATPWGFGTSVGPPTYDLEVRIREITGEPQRDAAGLENGYWIRVYPLKKVCNFRTDGTGRGEAY